MDAPPPHHGQPPPYNHPAATGYPANYGNNHNPPIQTAAPPSYHLKADGDWSTGLCDCFSDVQNCCTTFWCPCVTFGRVAEIVDQGSTSCGASGALYTLIMCVLGCGCLYSCFYRTKMRRQYMLKESPCPDCLVHCFCESCALCQEYRELEHRGFDMVLGWHGNIEWQRNRGVSMTPSAPDVQHMIR